MKATTRHLFLAIATLIVVFTSSCKNENVESISKAATSATCDTSAMTFNTKVKPILTDNCLRCHSNANAGSLGGGLPLESYADVAAERNNIVRVIDLNNNDASLMPKGGPKMSACDILKIKAWVRAGAPE